MAHVVVTLLLVAGLIASGSLDFAGFHQITANMARVGVPSSWLPMLGTVKFAGALGLLVGFGIPVIGTAAAIGVVQFFVLAVYTHLRVRDYSPGGGLALAIVFGAFGVGSLALGLV
jgi:hypothetical protein